MKSRIWIPALGLLAACGSGPCHQQRPEQMTAVEASMTQSQANERVRVSKPDGSLQCGQGHAISVDEMKKELQNIQVFSAENKADGLMHIQMCGTPTGRHNVYQINRSDLEKAKKLGFKEWIWD